MTSSATHPAVRAAALPRRSRWPVIVVMAIVLLLLTLRAFDSSARSDESRGRFTLPTPHTVFDSRTRLTWQREVDVRSCAPDTCTWERALAYCDELSLDGGGFRLPTRQELAALTDGSGAFSDENAWAAASTEEYFWTASAIAVNSRGARYSSQSTSTEDEVHTPRVRCVR